MAKDKYPIDKELTKLRNFNPPTSRAIIPFASFLMKNMPKGFNKKLVDVKYFKLGRITFYIITPKTLLDKVTPCVFAIHGGGFIFRSQKSQYFNEQEYALRCNSRVVGIDYDLSPKYAFPVALNQCFDVYNYLIDKCESLKINPNKLVVVGNSAGGLLACDLYLKLLKESKITPIGLTLIYPVLDNLMQTESMKKYNDTPCWNSIANKKMWEYYLQGQEYQSPLERINEFNINNIYIELAQYDCLHDEGLLLYNKLKDKVNYIVLNETPNTFHGYEGNIQSTIYKESMSKRIDFINKII